MKKVPLSTGGFAIVDADDFERVNRHHWYRLASGRGHFYAVRMARKPGGGKTMIRMHREVLRAAPGSLVDHRNHDGLDNRKENLRVCSHVENGQNRKPDKVGSASAYKGVQVSRGRWRARIVVDGRQVSLGSFETQEAAARAYDAAALQYFGEYAYTNFAEEAGCVSRA
ncbi:MAG: HNH endonuclease [Gemmatimonadetes bacterium]|nr:HNH endonuclease [Gemmatimonadota bacterium]